MNRRLWLLSLYSKVLGAFPAYLSLSIRWYPIGFGQSVNWQLTRCLPHQKVSPRTRRPTQNKKVPPIPVHSSDEIGVTVTWHRQHLVGVQTVTIPTNHPVVGVGGRRLQAWEAGVFRRGRMSREVRSDVGRRDHPDVFVVDDREMFDTVGGHHGGDLLQIEVRCGGLDTDCHYIGHL